MGVNWDSSQTLFRSTHHIRQPRISGYNETSQWRTPWGPVFGFRYSGVSASQRFWHTNLTLSKVDLALNPTRTHNLTMWVTHNLRFLIKTKCSNVYFANFLFLFRFCSISLPFLWNLTFFSADFWRIYPLLRDFSLFGTLRKVHGSASWGGRISEFFLLKKSLFLQGLSNCVRCWEVSASLDDRFWEYWLYNLDLLLVYFIVYKP